MNKTELVEQVAASTGLSKAASGKAVNAVFDTITKSLSRRSPDPVAVAGFGTFKVSRQKKRKGRNPQTGETIDISARKAPRFTAGKALKDSVN